MTQKIVITGAGVVSAIGIGKSESLNALLNARTGIEKVRYLPTRHKEIPVGEVKLSDDELTALVGVPEDEGMTQSRNAMIARLALREALTEAGIIDAEGSVYSSSLFSGSGTGIFFFFLLINIISLMTTTKQS